MRYVLISIMLLGLLFTASGQESGNWIFGDCKTRTFTLDRSEPWQKDTVESRTFVRNCYNSTTYLVLYKDFVFQYKLDGEINQRLAQGTWTLSNDSIRLTTDKIATSNFIETHKKYYKWAYMEISVDNYSYIQKDNELIEIKNE
jgi:hypothetical protein